MSDANANQIAIAAEQAQRCARTLMEANGTADPVVSLALIQIITSVRAAVNDMRALAAAMDARKKEGG